MGLTGEAAATPASPDHSPAVRPTDPGAYISFTPRSGTFPLVRAGEAAPIVVSDKDYDGVVRVAA